MDGCWVLIRGRLLIGALGAKDISCMAPLWVEDGERDEMWGKVLTLPRLWRRVAGKDASESRKVAIMEQGHQQAGGGSGERGAGCDVQQ